MGVAIPVVILVEILMGNGIARGNGIVSVNANGNTNGNYMDGKGVAM